MTWWVYKVKYTRMLLKIEMCIKGPRPASLPSSFCCEFIPPLPEQFQWLPIHTSLPTKGNNCFVCLLLSLLCFVNVTRRAGIWTKIQIRKKEREKIKNYGTVANLHKPPVFLRCRPFNEKPEENRGNDMSFHQTKADDRWPSTLSQGAAPGHRLPWKQGIYLLSKNFLLWEHDGNDGMMCIRKARELILCPLYFQRMYI